MRTAVWGIVGWLGLCISTAVGFNLGWGYLMPDIPVIVTVFVAMRREPIPMALCAVGLGYLVGRQAGLPTGVGESGMLLCGLVVYRMTGHFAGRDLFFASVCGGAAIGLQLAIFGLLYTGRGVAAFASDAAAFLVPGGFLTAVVALLLYRPMLRLDGRLQTARREGLSWS